MSGVRWLAEQAVATISSRSERDLQIKAGPSDMANQCDRCVGMAMARRRPDGPNAKKIPPGRVSLKGWTGTAVHNELQTKVEALGLPKVHTERKMLVCKIPGYGKVHGHIDLSYASRSEGGPLDYKNRDIAKIRKMRADNTPEVSSWNQVTTYGYAMEQAGLAVTECGLIYIPRDSNNVADIWIYVAPYERWRAKQVIKRATRIWKIVQAGNIDILQSSKDCYQCNSWERPGIGFKDEE